MSILIKGFPLPNNCGACPLRLAWCRERIYMVTRPERCPLVPIPPHGDLIDRDALEVNDGWMNEDRERNVLQTHITFVYSNDIANAPTIIPAEDGET